MLRQASRLLIKMTGKKSVPQQSPNPLDCFAPLAITGFGLRSHMTGTNLSLRGAKLRSNPAFVPATHENRDCFAPLAMTFFGSLYLKGYR